jgi:hypothetical protein
VRQQNALEELNALVLYRVVHEGMEDYVFLENNPAMTESEELYFDAMQKLAKVVAEKRKIQRILKVFDNNKHTKELLSMMGFNVFGLSKSFPLIYKIFMLNFKKSPERQEAMASMGRKKFLERFGNNSGAE